jgi:uncharacterized protein (TIGR02996 family)
MPCEVDFLEAIVHAPDDDVPRLVCADFLEETGDLDRAAFIRLQIELARIPDDDPCWLPLERRQDQLRLRHQREWVRPLLPFIEGWEFHRGFVEKVLMGPDAEWPEVLHLAPVRWIHFYQRCSMTLEEVQCIISPPDVTRLATLKISTDRGLRNDSAALIAETPSLLGLSCLDLSNNFIKNEGALLLAASPYLAALEALNLQNNPIGPPGKRALRDRFGARVVF